MPLHGLLLWRRLGPGLSRLRLPLLCRRPRWLSGDASAGASSPQPGVVGSGPPVRVTVLDKTGREHPVCGRAGDNLMYLLQRHELPVEGACEASLACCTCHVYICAGHEASLPPVTDAEEDMLDLAPFLRESSRLSCQIVLSPELDGLRVELPKATRNFYVDGHVPKPH